MTRQYLKTKVLQIAPWVVLLLGLFITASAWHARKYEKELLARAAFEREVQNAQGRLVKRIRSYEALLGLAEPVLDAAQRSSTKMADGSLLTDLPAEAVSRSGRPGMDYRTGCCAAYGYR